jgi:endonuclease/exonuclease/phosphatase family metal-dependent hydrolase
MLLCVFPINGCLTDSDTSHSSADYNQRLYQYTSQERPIQPSTKAELKFMTFNQRSGFIDGCVNNVTAQALIIREVDYVGTQETVQNVDTRCNRCNIPQIIANVAGMATRFGMAIPWRTGQYGISAGTSQLILETKFLTIPYAGYETRTPVAVKTQPLALQGRYLWFVNVHIEYYSIAVRQFQMSQILNWINTEIIARDSQAVIVMAGDFNGGPWQYEYGTLKAAGYKNTWEVFYGSILEGNTIPADWPGARFDHIWYRAPTGVTVNVKHAEVLNVRLSDHRPYVATLSFTLDGVQPTVAPPTTAPTTRPTTAPTTAPTTRPVESIVCVGPIWENMPVTFKCPNPAQKITSIQFASYGTPEGTCGNFKLGNCIGGSSYAVVKDKCLNYNSCTFPIANNVFGDPCPGTGKNFRAQVTCS